MDREIGKSAWENAIFAPGTRFSFAVLTTSRLRTAPDAVVVDVVVPEEC